MTDYDDNNRGQIWPNDKEGNEKRPDFTGSLNVEGVEYWVSGWKRKKGANPKAPSLSFSIQKKDKVEPKDYPQDSVAPKTPDDGFEDSVIPF